MTAAISAHLLSKRYAMPTAPNGWLEALTEVSFDVQQGEAVGLIGSNGAGKSTLLRILSRVTRPSGGYVDVDGTVGALLEVGTGFHPELTGRENTFLSGAILGLPKRDIQARFDEIVEFAEMAPFIDVPVKRYSSGMFARLGFAVAAHLRPSILIVDEVLAVGDLAFQAKCLAHMHRLTEGGTTVLFVSHNLLAVADLCRRSLVLAAGVLWFDGSSTDAISSYRRVLVESAQVSGASEQVDVLINGRTGVDVRPMGPDDSVQVEVRIGRAPNSESRLVILNVTIESSDGSTVVHLRSDLAGTEYRLAPGANRMSVVIDRLPLAPGEYTVGARLVSLDPAEPFILDSKRIPLTIAGVYATAAVLQPAHHFVGGAKAAARTDSHSRVPVHTR